MVHHYRVRADAQRNRERILGAARDLVAEAGADATMEDIARRAGVAVGTLYRHFPAKEDLVSAVVDDSVEFIADRAEEALAAADPGAQMVDLFRVVAERHATDRALKAAAGRLDLEAELETAGPGSAIARAAAAIDTLLARAQATGSVRADLTLADLALLLSAVPGAEVPVEMRRRFVDVLIAGLTAT